MADATTVSLSLSKGCPSLGDGQEGQGFDKLSLIGFFI
jgi:hypothetical protein